jgi:hypothetical protein
MTKRMRMAAATLAGLVMVLTMGTAATASASEADGPAPRAVATWGDGGGCAGGQADGQGATPLNSFRFTVCAHGADPHAAGGYFAAAGTPPSNVLVAPQGPVTCAAFRPGEVSFLYPLGPGSRPDLPGAPTAILIVAKDGGPQGPDAIGFVGPAPVQTFAGCGFDSPQALAAGAAALPLTSGSITVRP